MMGLTRFELFFRGIRFIYDGSGLVDEQETTKSIIEVSLTSGDKKIVYEVTGKGISITNVKCFGDKIFLL